MSTALSIGSIFGVLGAYNSFRDYSELNIYPMPDWAKLCDGSVINDVDSPLNGNYVPDLITRIPVGSSSAGTYIAAKTAGDGFYCFGDNSTQETISNIENSLTIKFFMRIK